MADFRKPIDVSDIVDKLSQAGVIKRNGTGYKGRFSILEHSHLLTESELVLWIHLLHEGTVDHSKECTDMHEWNFQECQ